MIPFGEWLPDQPDLRAPNLADARNVLPLDGGDYGPLLVHAGTSNALAGPCKGFGSGRAPAGSISVVAGTINKLYRLGALGAWTDISAGAGTYALASTDRWRFADFGSSLIAVAGVNVAPQAYNLAVGGSFAALSVNAPAAVHIAVVRDFVMLGHTKDGTTGEQPERVWWCGIGDPTSWPTPATASAASVQSGRQNLPDSGWVQGIVGGVGGADAIVLCEDKIWRVTYEGPPTVFRFDAIENGRGCYADGSICAVGPLVYFLTDDGFFVCDGVQSIPIGAGKVDRWFLDDLDHAQKDFIWSASDPERKLIVWAYPGSGNTVGRPNRLLFYNYGTKRFSRGETDVEALGAAFSQGYTLEDLDALGYTLDTLPYSLDSRFWAGGATYLGAVGADHRLGSYSGATAEAEIVIADSAPNSGQPAYANALQAYVDAPSPLLAMGYRDSLASPVTWNPYQTPGVDGRLRQRARGRYLRAGLKLPAGTAWAHAQGLEAAVRPNGRR